MAACYRCPPGCASRASMPCSRRPACARITVAWYGLRGHIGYSAELAYLVRMLREAGVLLQEPDSATTYRLLAVLSDPQADDRREGMDLRIGGYYGIENLSEGDAPSFTGVLWAASYAH